MEGAPWSVAKRSGSESIGEDTDRTPITVDEPEKPWLKPLCVEICRGIESFQRFSTVLHPNCGWTKSISHQLGQMKPYKSWLMNHLSTGARSGFRNHLEVRGADEPFLASRACNFRSKGISPFGGKGPCSLNEVNFGYPPGDSMEAPTPLENLDICRGLLRECKDPAA